MLSDQLVKIPSSQVPMTDGPGVGMGWSSWFSFSAYSIVHLLRRTQEGKDRAVVHIRKWCLSCGSFHVLQVSGLCR